MEPVYLGVDCVELAAVKPDPLAFRTVFENNVGVGDEVDFLEFYILALRTVAVGNPVFSDVFCRTVFEIPLVRMSHLVELALMQPYPVALRSDMYDDTVVSLWNKFAKLAFRTFQIASHFSILRLNNHQGTSLRQGTTPGEQRHQGLNYILSFYGLLD